MTGGPTGTYIKIGRDIAGLGKACGQTLNVVESAGSLENFSGVRNRKNTQFGIVQNDVLEYLKTFEANDPEIQQAVRGVRIMPRRGRHIHRPRRSACRLSKWTDVHACNARSPHRSAALPPVRPTHR